MPSTRLRLEPRELRGAATRVRAEFGPDARIVAAEEVRIGGLAGFFARRMYELTVEYGPTPPVAPTGTRAGGAPSRESPAAADAPPRMSGIAALLAEAERQESVLPGAAGAAAAPVSTQSDEFSDVLGALTASVGVSVATGPPPAAPFTPVPGGLLAIVGLRDDALRVASSLAAGMPGAQLGVAGDVGSGHPRIDDRRAATSLRAAGVEHGGIAVVAVGLGLGGPLAEANASRVAVLGADAVWVAVDATRKPDDTARWVAAVRAAVPVREMAVLDADLTESPESVHDLGLRRAWPEGVH